MTAKQISTILLSVFLLVGFTGNEKFVELSGYLNARSQAKFRSKDRNVLGVLSKGTRAEILDKKQLPSGNYGFKVEVLEGSLKGKKVWVYYNKSSPDFALYDVKPQDWEDIYREPATPENAAGVQAVRETPALPDPAEADKAPSSPIEEAQDTLKSLVGDSAESANTLLSSMRPVPRSSSIAGCTDCNEESLPTDSVRIARPTRSTKISDRCDAIMNNRGELGAHGEALYREMSKSENKKTFTRNNSMGNLCPKFRYLSEGQKLKAWTWFWAVLAHEESTCNPNVRHNDAINPTAGWGYWAMELYESKRYKRGPSCHGDIKKVSRQVMCSVSIMKNTRLKKANYSLTDGGDLYWGPLGRYRSQLLSKMERFTLCF